MTSISKYLSNAVGRKIGQMFPGHFSSTKHNHYKDFGYPEKLSFDDFYKMYCRNGFASAGVDKTAAKTWETNPVFSENLDPEITGMEQVVMDHLESIRFWQSIQEADKRSMVGGYSGLILRFADGQTFDKPVGRVSNGIEGLVEAIPCWAGQLIVSDWDTDQTSESYGKPKMFQYEEARVDDSTNSNNGGKNRQFSVHPDRVYVWSKDGTVHCNSLLESGFNSLIDMEKISGAGGEGFWKNAKGSPILETDSEADFDQMAQTMGITVEQLQSAMNDQVEDWSRGFDSMLMLQGIKAKSLGVTLPSPEHFFQICLQSYSASISAPQKIIAGNQNGERASTEDAEEWSRSNMSRRNNLCKPNLVDIIAMLRKANVLADKKWIVQWDDLTDSSPTDKVDRAAKMTEINSKSASYHEPIFTMDEVREAAGYEPLGIEYEDDEGDDEDLVDSQPPAEEEQDE